MANVSMQDLFKAGAHFGHQKRFWNPKMHEYVYGLRNNIHIINLEKTAVLFEEALNFISKIAADNGRVMFVGTKKAASKHIREQAERCGMPYVSHRWLGGMLTNFKTIKQSINRLKELESQKANGTFNRVTKKEALVRTREMEKLERNLSGIKDMEGMPDIIFVVDVNHERIALNEAKALAQPIPVVGIVDTNSSPEHTDYVIPANDDASRAIEFFVSAVADTIIEAKLNMIEEIIEVPPQDTVSEEAADQETASEIKAEEPAEETTARSETESKPTA